jgi:hypothetical protein
MRTALIAALCLPLAAQADSLTLTAGSGEYQHRTATERASIEARLDITPKVYAIGVQEWHHHPEPSQVNDQGMAGLGWRYDDWDLEAYAGENRWQVSAMHNGGDESWEVRSGLVVGDRWGGKAKRTNLLMQLGRHLGPVTLGAYYEVGNITQRHVSDWYGLYLRWRW